MKFSAKLTALSTAIFLVSCSVVTYFVYTSSTRVLEEQIKDKLEDQAFHTMDKIDRMLFERYTDIKSLASDEVIKSRKSSPEQITRKLTDFKNAYKDYASISFFDMNRIRLADTSGIDIGEQHAFNGYWPAIDVDREFVMVITECKALNIPVFYFAYIVRDNKNVPFGVVVSRMPVGQLYDIASKASGIHSHENNLNVSLVANDGLLLYSNQKSKGPLKEISPDWEAVRNFSEFKGKIGTVRHYCFGEEELSTFVHQQGYQDFKGNDWTLIVCIPIETAFAAATELRNRLLIILSILGVCIFLIILLFSLTVSRPMKKLSKAADKIGKGNLDINVKVTSGDEIGQLTQSFNKMALDLKEGRERYRKLNEELELKVHERTEQLLDAQEELVRKEKLSILGQLSGSVGHELRNPLGVISNAVYFLQTTMSGADETVREYLDIIKSEVNNSLRIISDLLEFSRTKTPQIRSIPVNEMISQSLDKCNIPGNITIQIDIPETLPLISVDPFQMGQVFQNLITNGVQAMPDGGVLRISARIVPSSKFQVQGSEIPPLSPPLPRGEMGGRDFIEISVTDTGEGISPENMSKLFQPLFTTKARGIGLGLALSKRIIEANNGSIEVQSQSGKGTTFTVILPVEK